MGNEEILQQTFVGMFRTLYPSCVLNLSLNGISLNGLPTLNKAQLIAQAKRQGMEVGMPDLSIYLPKGVVLNLEFKRPNGGVQSPDQKLIESKLKALGHNYHLVRSIEEVFELISLNTLADFRHTQFDNLEIPNDGNLLTDQFLHWSKGTTLIEVQTKLKQLYHIVRTQNSLNDQHTATAKPNSRVHIV